MGHLSRIGVAIGSELLEQFDLLIAGQGYENRSEVFRDLIRERLVSQGSRCARPRRRGNHHSGLRSPRPSSV
jgi:metal-responsive CopG/Arc/MetJ family transcriptional regulator